MDTTVEAEYADGYIHSEEFHGDSSPYVVGKNIMNDIAEKRAERAHGKLVRFSVYYHGIRHDLLAEDLPDGATPIRYRDGYSRIGEGRVEEGWSGCRYGYILDGKEVLKEL